QPFEVALELGLEVVVEHGNSLGEAMRKRIGTDAGWLAGGRGGEGIHLLAGPASAPIRSRAVAWTARGGMQRWSGRGARMRSDLADQVQRRLEGLLAFLPLGRADLVRVGGDVLRGLELAQGLGDVAGDRVVVDLDGLDHAF